MLWRHVQSNTVPVIPFDTLGLEAFHGAGDTKHLVVGRGSTTLVLKGCYKDTTVAVKRILLNPHGKRVRLAKGLSPSCVLHISLYEAQAALV